MYQKANPERLKPPRKVLVISGDGLLGEIMTKLLDRYFACEVYQAACTSEATSRLYLGGFDLFLVDLSTPGVSGAMLIRQIQNMSPLIPILVVSSGSSDEEIDEIHNLGISQIIYKPIRIAAFLEVVAGMLMESQHIYT
jgi:two-component system, sensor histidine kinase